MSSRVGLADASSSDQRILDLYVASQYGQHYLDFAQPYTKPVSELLPNGYLELALQIFIGGLSMVNVNPIVVLGNKSLTTSHLDFSLQVTAPDEIGQNGEFRIWQRAKMTQQWTLLSPSW